MSKEEVFCYKVTHTDQSEEVIFLNFKNIEPFIRDGVLTIKRIRISDGLYSKQIMQNEVYEIEKIIGIENILNWIKKEKFCEFTQRDFHYRFKSKFKNVKDLEPCFDYLKKYNYIEELPVKKVSHRPSRAFKVLHRCYRSSKMDYISKDDSEHSETITELADGLKINLNP